MVSEIPQELIDATIDCLTDPQDLSRCALVGRSWQPPAQSRIFQTVSLGVGIQNGFASGLVPDIPPLGTDFDNFQPFHHLLKGSPHLALYIRTLNLGLPPLESELAPSLNHLALCPDSWQIIDDSVVAFLSLLQRLESLGLFPCGNSTHTFHLQPRIFNAFRALSLQSIDFSQWFFADSSALSSFEINPLSCLRFLKCDFQGPLRALFSNDLVALELHHCEVSKSSLNIGSLPGIGTQIT
ncbi:hypothetical protein B0H14DRAFT_2572483 [Mycena olivaceomarginata]|nr:hypothetical protein B0H14DRAFT_2572483 [Mycena olivaceomarginata]